MMSYPDQKYIQCSSSRNSLSTKRLQACKKSTNRNQIVDETTSQNIRKKKQRWSIRKLPTDDSAQIIDTKSESSIEYDYTNPAPVSMPSVRRVSIATIYLQDEQWHQLELFIKHFSSCVSLSNNLNINSSTTHLLVDDSSTSLQCIFSKKIFQAVARRIFIVSIRWIEECLLRNEISDETSFEIRGDGSMFTMHLARQSPTLSVFSSSISFAIDCNSFQRVLTRHDLAELAILSGATLFTPEQTISTKILLVLVDPTAARCQLEEKYKQYHMNIKFLTPGFLLKSIIYQKQQPFEDFEL